MNEIPYVSHHAQSRAAERYGIPATPAIWADAVLRILDAVEGKPRALLLRRYNSGIELWQCCRCQTPPLGVW